MTTGEPLVINGAMKPISTLRLPLESVDLKTKEFLLHISSVQIYAQSLPAV